MFDHIRITQWTCIHVFFLLGLLVFMVLSHQSENLIQSKLQNAVFDQFNRWHTRSPSEKVVIVDIDERSLEEVGQWPWSRNIMAELIRNLHLKGAKVIAFDGVFAEADRYSPHILFSDLSKEQIMKLPETMQKQGELVDYDDLFAREIKKSKVFVTAFSYGRVNRLSAKPYDKKRIFVKNDVKDVFLKRATRFSGAAVNLKALSKAAAGTGSFMANPDEDGVLRRASMVFSDGETLYPALGLEAVRVAIAGRKDVVFLGRTPIEQAGEIDTQYRITFKDKVIPVEEDGIIYVHYRHFCNDENVSQAPIICPKSDYVSASKFLAENSSDDINLEGKVVLIGASAEGLKDLRSTALAPFKPGVEVHANIIEQILDDHYLLRPFAVNIAETIYVISAGLFFIIVSQFIGVLVSVALCMTLLRSLFSVLSMHMFSMAY